MWLSQDVDSRDVFTTFLHDRGRFRACSIWFTCISSSILLSSCRVIAALTGLLWSLLLGRFRYSVTMVDWPGTAISLGFERILQLWFQLQVYLVVWWTELSDRIFLPRVIR